MNLNISSAALEALATKSLSFIGTHPNFPKMRQYQELKTVLSSLSENVLTVRTMEELPPDRSRPSAMISLEYDTVIVIPPALHDLFLRAVQLSDGVTLSCASGSPAITFTVLNVWED